MTSFKFKQRCPLTLAYNGFLKNLIQEDWIRSMASFTINLTAHRSRRTIHILLQSSYYKRLIVLKLCKLSFFFFLQAWISKCVPSNCGGGGNRQAFIFLTEPMEEDETWIWPTQLWSAMQHSNRMARRRPGEKEGVERTARNRLLWF